MACFGCAKLVIHHGPSGQTTIHHQEGMLKGTMAGLLISKLFATCWGMLFQVFKLAYLYLERVCLGLVSGAIVCIRLFWPSRDLSLDVLACWSPLAKLGNSAQASVPKEVCSHLFCWELLVDPLDLVWMMHFWTLWLFQVLCLSLERLIGPILVHRSGHGKGRSKISQLGFWCGA